MPKIYVGDFALCELFGLSANREVSVSFTWRGFLRRGKGNPDGWGVAWYADRRVFLVKEPRPSVKSPIARFLLSKVKGHVFISHVRWATEGGVNYVNTHPFVRKLHDYEWVFAHNGDVSGIMGSSEFRLKYYFPVGDTDSEYAFCYIMDNLRELGEEVSSIIKTSKIIWELANKIGDYGKFNFLLSNGEYLFSYMNRSGTLHYLLRHPPHRGYVKLEDEDFEVRLEEIKGPDEFAALIATKPLTSENWVPFELGCLYVFSSGDILLKVNGQGRLEYTLSSIEVEVLRLIRTSPRSVKLAFLSRELELSLNEAYSAVRMLVAKGFLRQDRRYPVPMDSPEARFFTEPRRREVIDLVILE